MDMELACVRIAESVCSFRVPSTVKQTLVGLCLYGIIIIVCLPVRVMSACFSPGTASLRYTTVQTMRRKMTLTGEPHLYCVISSIIVYVCYQYLRMYIPAILTCISPPVINL